MYFPDYQQDEGESQCRENNKLGTQDYLRNGENRFLKGVDGTRLNIVKMPQESELSINFLVRFLCFMCYKLSFILKEKKPKEKKR